MANSSLLLLNHVYCLLAIYWMSPVMFARLGGHIGGKGQHYEQMGDGISVDSVPSISLSLSSTCYAVGLHLPLRGTHIIMG